MAPPLGHCLFNWRETLATNTGLTLLNDVGSGTRSLLRLLNDELPVLSVMSASEG